MRIINLVTLFSREECVRRLRANVVTEDEWEHLHPPVWGVSFSTAPGLQSAAQRSLDHRLESAVQRAAVNAPIRARLRKALIERVLGGTVPDGHEIKVAIPRVRAESGVVGKIGDIKIRLRRDLPSRNDFFQTYLFGRFTGEGNYTRLQCFVLAHPAFYLFGMLLVATFLLISYNVLSGKDTYTMRVIGQPVHGWWGPAFVMMATAYFLFSRYRRRNEGKFLLHFLRKTIDVSDAR